MKTYKRIITIICILALAINITAFAKNGYSVKYNDDNSKVTVSISDTINEEVEALTNTTLALKSNGAFPTTTSTGQTIKNFGSWTKGAMAANKDATKGQTGYYNLPSATPFQNILSGDIEDYNLVVTFQKGCSNGYIENIEMGLGNAKGTSGYGSLPTVVHTYALGDFGYTSAANGTEWTFTIDVADLINNGNKTLFPASGTPNELTGDNINLFAVKAKYRIASTQTAVLIKFSSIKFVAKSGSDPLPSSYSLMTAFYDVNGNLLSGNAASGAPTSLISDVPNEATSLRNFLWADHYKSLKPVRPAFKAIIPIKRSILFIGGRGAVDSSRNLSALAQAEGFEFNVDCIYYKGRDLRDHWRNICAGGYEYELMRNGSVLGGTTYRIEDILSKKNYDIIILEQSSGYSGAEDTIFPYLDYIADYLNEKCPSTMLCYNTLWPYTSDYTGTIFQFYNNDPKTMSDMINSTAEYIDSRANVDIINTNDIVYNLANTDKVSLYQAESETSFYRLNATGQAAVQAQILYSLSGCVPKAGSITSVYSGVTAANANKIINYLK